MTYAKISLRDREHLPPADLLILDAYNANRAE